MTKRGPQVRKDKYFKNTTVIRSKNSKLLAISLLFEVFKFLKQIAFFNSLKAPVLYIHVYLVLPTRAGSPQQHMPITVGPFFFLTHPVNFPCGRKPEYPEETHDFRQSVDFYSFHMRTGFESH